MPRRTPRALNPAVTATGEAFTLEDGKRCYVPGVKISGDCPKCKVKQTADLSNHPLSYPSVNMSSVFTLNCTECCEDFTVPIYVTFTVALEK
jgi:hypothetical protein